MMNEMMYGNQGYGNYAAPHQHQYAAGGYEGYNEQRGNNYGHNNNRGGYNANQNRTQNRGQNYGQGNDAYDGGVAQAVKAGQRCSQTFKQAWHQYCELAGHQTYDPNKHDTNFLQGFFDAVAGGYMENLKNNPNSGKGKGKGAKGYPVGTHPALPKVIELVKQGQRNSAEWKNMWIEWCQKQGAGVQDPNRHSALFVIAFVLKFGLEPVVNASWAGPYLVSLGELCKPFMVQTIKKGQSLDETWKQAWGNFADSKMNGTRDPNRHDAGSLMEFFDTIAMQKFRDEPWMVGYLTGTAVDEPMGPPGTTGIAGSGKGDGSPASAKEGSNAPNGGPAELAK